MKPFIYFQTRTWVAGICGMAAALLLAQSTATAQNTTLARTFATESNPFADTRTAPELSPEVTAADCKAALRMTANVSPAIPGFPNTATTNAAITYTINATANLLKCPQLLTAKTPIGFIMKSCEVFTGNSPLTLGTKPVNCDSGLKYPVKHNLKTLGKLTPMRVVIKGVVGAEATCYKPLVADATLSGGAYAKTSLNYSCSMTEGFQLTYKMMNAFEQVGKFTDHFTLVSEQTPEKTLQIQVFKAHSVIIKIKKVNGSQAINPATVDMYYPSGSIYTPVGSVGNIVKLNLGANTENIIITSPGYQASNPSQTKYITIYGFNVEYSAVDLFKDREYIVEIYSVSDGVTKQVYKDTIKFTHEEIPRIGSALHFSTTIKPPPDAPIILEPNSSYSFKFPALLTQKNYSSYAAQLYASTIDSGDNCGPDNVKYYVYFQSIPNKLYNFLPNSQIQTNEIGQITFSNGSNSQFKLANCMPSNFTARIRLRKYTCSEYTASAVCETNRYETAAEGTNPDTNGNGIPYDDYAVFTIK